MNPQTRLTILFDCCHSGSACELPFVFRPDENGNVNLVDTVKKGIQLVGAAEGLLQGGFSLNKIADAKMLLGGATDFFNSLHHKREDVDQEGLAAENFAEGWEREGKDVWMFSGCADDQTSADTSIAGSATGAMSWAFIGSMRQYPGQSYLNVSPGSPASHTSDTRRLMSEQVLQNTRGALVNNYSQVPQLSCGGHYDLDQPIYVSLGHRMSSWRV
jgi:metacaspase-1